MAEPIMPPTEINRLNVVIKSVPPASDPLPGGLAVVFEPIETDHSTYSNILHAPVNKAIKGALNKGIITPVSIPKDFQYVPFEDASGNLGAPQEVQGSNLLLSVFIPIADNENLSHENCLTPHDYLFGAPQGCVHIRLNNMSIVTLYEDTGISLLKLEGSVKNVDGTQKLIFEIVTAKYFVLALLPNGTTCYVAFTFRSQAEEFIREYKAMPAPGWKEVGCLVWNDAMRSNIVYYNPPK